MNRDFAPAVYILASRRNGTLYTGVTSNLPSRLYQHRTGQVRDDDPVRLAQFVWSVTHGVAMLAIDGQLRDADSAAGLNRFAIDRLRAALAPGDPADPLPAPAA